MKKAVFDLMVAGMLAVAILPGCKGGGDAGIFPLPVKKNTPQRVLTLPDTGQTTCYDGSNNATDCVDTGQDGEHPVNPMSFTDNEDETVTDNVTGLMWQREDDDTPRNWAEAGTYCDGLSLGNHFDWRLPTIAEFTNIVDFGASDPSIRAAAFPGVTSDAYWSSTAAAFNASTYAWYLYALYGDTLTGGQTADSYALCVRGAASPAPDFTDNGNGTVTDNNTHLVWQKEDDNTPRTWQEALDYCNALSLAGRDDWRLPNIKELASIVDTAATAPAIDAAFPDTDDYYWSSTSYEAFPGNAWRVEFIDGYVNSFGKTSSINVRCVR